MTEVIPYTRRPAESSFSADWLLDPAEIAQRIGGTDFVPEPLRNNPAAITAALLFGAEVGLGRMQSLAKIAVINGRPTMFAEAQRALILAAGHDIWIEESTINRCTIAGRRRDSEQVSRVTWTMEDARRANLAGKAPWRLYPRQMLLARASAELARAIFPDAIGGLAATEEYEDEVPQDGAAPEAKPPTTRRRRRASAKATSEPTLAAVPDTESDAQPATPEQTPEPEKPSGGLPAAEQAVVDEVKERFDATEVEPEAYEPPPTPEPEGPPPITDAQRRKIHALFREKGIIDRGDRLLYCGQVIGRDVPTSTDLTLDEASQIIDHLDQYDPNNPQTLPFPEGF